MKSSYEKNNYGKIFELMMRSYQPRLVVELGVLHGYSLIHMAKGLQFNKEHFGLCGHIDAYDLWDNYEYNHGDMNDVQMSINNEGLSEFVTLNKMDAYEVYKKYDRRSVYILHVDISNTGETVRKIVEQWNDKMVHDGIILLEGGSVERDNVDWMIKYNKPSIREEVNTNEIIDKFYLVGTFNKFPSLTMLYKKYDEEHMP